MSTGGKCVLLELVYLLFPANLDAITVLCGPKVLGPDPKEACLGRAQHAQHKADGLGSVAAEEGNLGREDSRPPDHI